MVIWVVFDDALLHTRAFWPCMILGVGHEHRHELMTFNTIPIDQFNYVPKLLVNTPTFLSNTNTLLVPKARIVSGDRNNDASQASVIIQASKLHCSCQVTVPHSPKQLGPTCMKYCESHHVLQLQVP